MYSNSTFAHQINLKFRHTKRENFVSTDKKLENVPYHIENKTMFIGIVTKASDGRMEIILEHEDQYYTITTSYTMKEVHLYNYITGYYLEEFSKFVIVIITGYNEAKNFYSTEVYGSSNLVNKEVVYFTNLVCINE